MREIKLAVRIMTGSAIYVPIETKKNYYRPITFRDSRKSANHKVWKFLGTYISDPE